MCSVVVIMERGNKFWCSYRCPLLQGSGLLMAYGEAMTSPLTICYYLHGTYDWR